MEFQAWDLRLLLVFFATLTIATDEMKVVFLGFFLRKAKTGSVLPNIASLTGDARRAIILDSG